MANRKNKKGLQINVTLSFLSDSDRIQTCNLLIHKSFTDAEKLKVAFDTESKSEKPRESVLKAIQERIEELSKQ